MYLLFLRVLNFYLFLFPRIFELLFISFSSNCYSLFFFFTFTYFELFPEINFRVVRDDCRFFFCILNYHLFFFISIIFNHLVFSIFTYVELSFILFLCILCYRRFFFFSFSRISNYFSAVQNRFFFFSLSYFFINATECEICRTRLQTDTIFLRRFTRIGNVVEIFTIPEDGAAKQFRASNSSGSIINRDCTSYITATVLPQSPGYHELTSSYELSIRRVSNFELENQTPKLPETHLPSSNMKLQLSNPDSFIFRLF